MAPTVDMLKRALNTGQLLWATLAAFISLRGSIVLALLPNLVLVTTIAVFILALEAGGTLDRISGGLRFTIADFLFLIFAYLVASLAVLYFSAALVSAIRNHIEGAYSELGVSFDEVNDRFGEVIGFAAFGATAAVPLKRIVRGRKSSSASPSAIFGGAWPWATPLTLPALVIEGLGPLDALRRAGELFEQTWGARAAPNFGYGVAYLLLAVLIATPAAGLYVATGSAATGLALAAIIALPGLTVLRTSEVVLGVALYYYAASGDRGIAPERMLRFAYVPKARRGRWPRSQEASIERTDARRPA